MGLTQVPILWRFYTLSTSIILALALEDNIQPVLELQRLLSMNCKIEKVYPASPASDAEVNIITVTVICPKGDIHSIRAFREEASTLREYVRLLNIKEWFEIACLPHPRKEMQELTWDYIVDYSVYMRESHKFSNMDIMKGAVGQINLFI